MQVCQSWFLYAVFHDHSGCCHPANSEVLLYLGRLRKGLVLCAGTSSVSPEELFQQFAPHFKRLIEEEFIRHKYQRAGTGFTVSLPVEDSEEERLWQQLVVTPGVPCQICPTHYMLSPCHPILAELRYLRFKLGNSQYIPLSAIINMRRERQQQEPQDLEVPYHRIVVAVAEAAADGQDGISFLKEDHQGSARPDLRCCVHGQPKYPVACLPKFGCAHLGSNQGFKSNRAGLSKLLKAILSLHGGQASGKHLCLYVSRSEYVWVAEFFFATPGKLSSITFKTWLKWRAYRR